MHEEINVKREFNGAAEILNRGLSLIFFCLTFVSICFLAMPEFNRQFLASLGINVRNEAYYLIPSLVNLLATCFFSLRANRW